MSTLSIFLMIILGTLFISVIVGIFVSMSNTNPNYVIPKYVNYDDLEEYGPVYLVSSEQEAAQDDITSKVELQNNATTTVLDEIFASVETEEVSESVTASEFTSEMESNLNLLMAELNTQPVIQDDVSDTEDIVPEWVNELDHMNYIEQEEINLVPVAINVSHEDDNFNSLLSYEPLESEMVFFNEEVMMQNEVQPIVSKSSIAQEDIEYLTELYGALVDYVTTTPDIGRKYDVDVMIGQIIKDSDQLYIAYRNAKVLVGKNAKFFVGETVIVLGSFTSKACFNIEQIKLAKEAAENINIAV